jgi:hypothetical protein
MHHALIQTLVDRVPRLWDDLQGRIGTTGDASMSKRQSIGLIFMIGSAAAAIQMTLFFSPIMRGWFYSICLGILAIVFASGADMFRGNE